MSWDPKAFMKAAFNLRNFENESWNNDEIV